MNKTLLLAGVAACLFSANANATELKQYVSGKLTYSDVSHDIKVSGEDEDYVYSGKMDFSDNVWGGSFAYGVKANDVRAELEVNLKQDAEKKVSGLDEDGDAYSQKLTVENQSVMLNAYYDINTGSKLTPYVGGGIGIAHLKGSIKEDGLTESKSKTNFAWQIGAGVSYALTDNVAIDAGYRYTDAGDVKITDEDGISGKFESKSHEFLLGARYAF